jgi:hypothetical protein
MLKSKNAFDWQGQPSIWMRDKELKQVAAGQAFGKNARGTYCIDRKERFFYLFKG